MSGRVRGVAAVALLAGLGSACAPNEECRRLEQLLERTKRVEEDAVRRAEASKTAAERAKKAEKDAHAAMAELGLDDTEKEVQAELEARAKKVEGATVTRRALPPAPTANPIAPARETAFMIEYPARDERKALETMWQLLEGPYLFLFSTFVYEPKTRLARLEVTRATVDQVPIDPKPIPLESTPDPDEVPKQLGFCGAGALRERIAESRQRIAAAKEGAEALTVHMPRVSSWEGVRRRSGRIRDFETENRLIMKILLEAAKKSGASLVGIGYEDPAIVLEIEGDELISKKMTAALYKQASELRTYEATKGRLRFGLPNPVIRQRPKSEPGERHEAHTP